MNIIAYNPLTIIRPLDGANGRNWPLFAIIDPEAKFFASIFAQEVYESRFKTLHMLPFMLIAGLLFAVAAYNFGVSLWFTPHVALLAGLASIMPSSFRRKLELRGQAVESVVKADLYGMNLQTALANNAAQLTSYSQFKGWPQSKIFLALALEVPTAIRWITANRALVSKQVQ